MCIKRVKEHEHKAREGSHNDFPLSQLIPAPAYSGEETGRIAQFAARSMRQIGSLAVPRFAGFQPEAGMYI